MLNRRRLCLFIAGWFVVGASGCGGSTSNERKNDPGALIQLNPKGPPPMRSPAEGGSSLPPQLKDKK